MEKSTFYHAGCTVCVGAERELLKLIKAETIDIVHLGLQKENISKAEIAGVKSVPALVTATGAVLHINHGANLSDLKN